MSFSFICGWGGVGGGIGAEAKQALQRADPGAPMTIVVERPHLLRPQAVGAAPVLDQAPARAPEEHAVVAARQHGRVAPLVREEALSAALARIDALEREVGRLKAAPGG